MSEQTLSNAYHNFVIHCRNKHTRQNYESRLKKFLSYCQVETYDDLLFNGDLKLIQTRITDFLIHLQGDQSLSPATVSYYFVAIRFFYNMNDVIAINWGKISKVLPEFRKVANDRPYRSAEISRLLEKVDHRGRIIILLMASSGMREGAIHSIKLSDIETLQDIYKITVYKNNPAEYYTFCSPECTKAIYDYSCSVK